MKKLLISLAAGGALFAMAGVALAASVGPIDFESYTLGNINGQQGWSALGSAGSGCAVYDEGVASSGGVTGFGSQSFRISDAVVSGCFGDQAFAPGLSDAAGEATASTSVYSAGTIQPHFEAQFDIAAIAGDSDGSFLSVSPDLGNGARMSYLRFEYHAGGINVFFDDDTDPSHVANADTFNETQIATLNPSVPHTIKFSMDFNSGPDNDVVNIYIDGILVHTGTSWEDYYRYDVESNPGLDPNFTPAVRTLLFREGGSTNTPADAGKGYLIDNLSLESGPVVLPSVTTNSATGETTSTATLNGTNGPVNAANTSFWWGTTVPTTPITTPGSNPAATSEWPGGDWQHDGGLGGVSAGGSFLENIGSLTPGATYYFVAWVEVGGIWYPGQTLSFVVPTPAGSCPAGTVQSASPLETVNINSNSDTPTLSAHTLASGTPYVFVSSGTWQNSTINVVDSMYASLNNWTTYQEGYDTTPFFLGPEEFNLEVNNAFTDWGPYSTGHSYQYLYTGTGSKANFLVFDGNSNNGSSAINPAWYGDNSGSLSVAIYKCTKPSKVTVTNTNKAVVITHTSANSSTGGNGIVSVGGNGGSASGGSNANGGNSGNSGTIKTGNASSNSTSVTIVNTNFTSFGKKH